MWHGQTMRNYAKAFFAFSTLAVVGACADNSAVAPTAEAPAFVAPANFLKTGYVIAFRVDNQKGATQKIGDHVINIPANVNELPKDAGKADGSALPQGSISVATDFGTPGYGGPCPPAGDKPHHYRFTIYALKVDKLDVPRDAKASFVGFNVNANAIGKATLVGTYGRSK